MSVKKPLLELNNDEVHEWVETLFITISDPEGLSQFANDTAYARIKTMIPLHRNRKPTEPYDVSEGNSIKLDAVNVIILISLRRLIYHGLRSVEQ